MGRWGDAADKAQGPSDYLKLIDGTKVRIRILTDPVVQSKVFDSDPDNPKSVFSWVVWDYDHQACKILSKSGAFAKRLDAISENWGDEIPMKCDIVIETTGTKLNTKYELVAVPANTPLPPDWQAQVGNLDLNKLLPGHIPIQEFLNADAKPQDPSSFNQAAQAPAEEPAPSKVDDIFDVDDNEPISLDDIPF